MKSNVAAIFKSQKKAMSVKEKTRQHYLRGFRLAFLLSSLVLLSLIVAVVIAACIRPSGRTGVDAGQIQQHRFKISLESE